MNQEKFMLDFPDFIELQRIYTLSNKNRFEISPDLYVSEDLEHFLEIIFQFTASWYVYSLSLLYMIGGEIFQKFELLAPFQWPSFFAFWVSA